MTGDQVIRELKDRTSLEVSEVGIRNAIAAQPQADVEAACKQVVDWFVSGNTRSPHAHPILTAAMRMQLAPRHGKVSFTPEQRRTMRALECRAKIRSQQETFQRLYDLHPEMYADLERPRTDTESVAAKAIEVYGDEARIEAVAA